MITLQILATILWLMWMVIAIVSCMRDPWWAIVFVPMTIIYTPMAWRDIWGKV